MPLLDPNVEIPADFKCPVLLEIMTNPVILADGHSYEREVIEQWLAGHSTSPITNLPLANKTLTPNHALRKSIEAFIESSNKQYQERQQRNEARDSSCASTSQITEALESAFESVLSLSALEHASKQLLGLHAVAEAKSEVLEHELSQQERHTLFLRRQVDEAKLSLQEKQKHQDHLVFLDKRLAEQPGNTKLINKKASTLLKLGRYAESLDILNASLSTHADNVFLLNTRGGLLRKIGKYNAALNDFDAILEQDARNVYAIDGKASVYHALGDTEQEHACVHQIIGIDPRHWRVKKLSASGGGSAAQRRSAPTSAFSTPTHASASELCDQAKHHKANQRYPQALRAIERALTLEPDNTYFMCNRADTLAHLQRQEDAIEQFADVLEIEPDNTYALYGQASVFERLGDTTNAALLFEQVLALQPRHQRAKQALKRLAKGGGTAPMRRPSYVANHAGFYGTHARPQRRTMRPSYR